MCKALLILLRTATGEGESHLSTRDQDTGTWNREGDTLTLNTDRGEVLVFKRKDKSDSHAATAQVVDIPDPNLRAEIERELGRTSIAPITAADMESLTTLYADGAGISDLTGLEAAINLTELRLDANNISDISSVSELTHLTQLMLSHNSLSDLSAVSGLTNLTNLGLRRNSISDLSALSGLTNLTNLGLNANAISDLSPLVSNTGLGSGDRVDVQGNPLNAASINTHIPTLQSRGVTVEFDTVVVQTLDIPDPNLRTKIEAALGKASGDTITVTDMAMLTTLHASFARDKRANGA